MDREEFFFEQVGNRPASELAAIQDAYWFAKEIHRDQTRDSGERYFEHPRRVVLILINFGYISTAAIIAGLTHDIVEDGLMPPRILVNALGIATWRRVSSLSKKLPFVDPVTGKITKLKKDTVDYFKELAASDEVTRATKVADRIDNLSTCDVWEEGKRRRYITESREFILPLAKTTNAGLLEALEAAISRVEATLPRASASA